MELHLRELGQLFDSLDPSTFYERDLTPNAEEYIVDSFKESPDQKKCTLVIYLDQPMGPPDEERSVGEAIRIYFARKSHFLRRDLRQLFRRGFISLAIALAFLVAVIVVAQFASRLMGESTIAVLVKETMIISGWVAMWKPLQIFLYDWWPILGERHVYDRLSRIRVRIVYKAVEDFKTGVTLPGSGTAH